MSSIRPTQPFRFLDLPGEIRNNIYDLLLCSWEDQLEQDSSRVVNLSRRCPSYPAASLLRANKQIHSEASDYMIKHNQFVRITCRNIDVRTLLLSSGVPVITTDARKVDQHEGYVMQMTLSKPVFSSSIIHWGEFEIMMLRSDLPRLCESLDIESVMADANSSAREHTSIHAEIKLNYAYARFFTPKIQERLLSPISDSLRGIANLRIMGPIDPVLAQSVAAEVSKPRWTHPDETLEEIGTGVDVGKRQWQQNDFYTAAESWSYAMRTLERMRHSSSWLGLKEAGGEDFVNKTADLYFTLNLFHAQFLQVDMAGDNASMPLVQRNGKQAILHLRKCETASARFAQHVDATWVPSNQQRAKMLFRHAKCLRLMRDSSARVKAVTMVEQAALLAPNDVTIRDEKDATLAWNAEIEENVRVMEQQISTQAQQESRTSLWSSLWVAVAELAS